MEFDVVVCTLVEPLLQRDIEKSLFCLNEACFFSKPRIIPSLPSNTGDLVESPKSGLDSWSNNKGESRQKQLRQLRKGLAEAKNSLRQVKDEVETSSEILRR